MRMEHPYLEREGIPERYVTGGLSEEEEARFEEHYLTCRDCLEHLEAVGKFNRALKGLAQEELAESLASRRLAAVARWIRFGRSRQVALILAAVLLLVILPNGLWWREMARLGEELEGARQAEPQVNIPILRLSPERSAPGESDPVNRITLPPDLPSIVLSLEWDGPVYPAYRVSLVNPDGKTGWQRSDLRRDHRGDLVMILPSSLLEAGDFLLRVEGLPPGGEGVPVAPFTFRVSR